MRTSVLILIFLLGCSTKETVQQTDYSKRLSPIPKSIIAKMDAFIYSKMGQINFHKYLQYDSIQSGLFPGCPNYLKSNVVEKNRFMANDYLMFVYFFYLPDKPWHRWKLWWPADTLGGFIKDNDPLGIPDCESSSFNCSFSIDSLEAISIAKQSGLSADKTPLSAGIWFDKGKIVWMVGTTVTQSKYDAEVKYYTIDMNTGEIVSKGGWTIVH